MLVSLFVHAHFVKRKGFDLLSIVFYDLNVHPHPDSHFVNKGTMFYLESAVTGGIQLPCLGRL